MGPEDLGEMLYEGKAKKLYAVQNWPELVVIEYKDDATANNGEKKGQIANKGKINNAIASKLFEVLKAEGIPTHFVRKRTDTEMVCKKVEIIKLEVIIRNLIAGSMAKRLGIKEGTAPETTIFELSYKDDSLGDPLINDYHAVGIGAATFEEIETIKTYAFKINRILKRFFSKRRVNVVDFKLEFGRVIDENGEVTREIVLADEISPDTCRFWDQKTNEKLDKDRFRRDLGGIEEAYNEIEARILMNDDEVSRIWKT